ncbi:MAG: FtsX-like permease family protein [Lachnospiraceae bacterium]|nr:FtsX-like permease family protein [Lachnospiraceae bacterium]
MKNNNGAAIRRLSKRSLQNNRMRNLFAMLAIILTGVLFTAVFSLVSGMMQISQEDTMREVGGRFHAGLKEATREQYEKVITDPLIKDYNYNIFIGLADNIVKHQAELRYLPEEKYLADMFITLEEGHLPVERNEIVVNTFILDELGLPYKLGEKVPIDFTFQGKEIKEEFIVCGYYQGDHISHASELFLSEIYWEELKGGLTDEDFIEWGEEHPNDQGVGLMSVNFFFYDDSNLEEKVQTVIRNAGYEPGSELRYGVNWAYMSSRMESADPLSVIVLTAVIVIILITGYLIIYNIFQISVVSDIRFYGLLKTIGTTKGQIRRLVRRQAVVLSAVGIPVGLIIGYGVGKLILPFATSFSDYGNASTSLKFNPWIFVFSAVFSAFTVFISCRKPGKIAGSVSPVEAVKFTGTEGKKKAGKRKSGREEIKKRHRHFSAASMAFANLGRNKRSATAVIAAVSFSMILLAVITTAVNSFQLDEYVEQRIAGDYMLGNVSVTGTARGGNVEIEPDYLALADSQKGIESRSEMWVRYGSRLLIDEKAREQFRKLDTEGKLRRETYNNEKVDSMLRGEENDMAGYFYGYGEELLRNLEVLEGTLDVAKFSTGDYILLGSIHTVNDLPAEDHAYHPGDRVTVESITEDSVFHEIKDENGETIDIVYENLASKEYEVMAIVNIPYSMNLHRYTPNACDAVLPLSEFTVKSDLFAVSYRIADEYQEDFEAAVKEYSDTHTEMGYISKDSLRKEFENMVTVVGTLGIALCAIIALIGMLNFVNAVVTEIISRKREFAMLQSIGMTNDQLRKMLICEGISYVAISGVLSFLIGSPLSWLVLNAINNIILFFDYRFQILPFLIMLPLLLLVAALAPLMAYRNLKKKSIVDRLRETE